MTKYIKYQLFLPHPAWMVWEYLANAELMEKWIMKNSFLPIKGVDFQFMTTPVSSLDFNGIFYCKVLTVVPFRELSYSWESGPR
jgi:uncharacterized protein YndB with AHSA1/START domain